MAIDPRKNLRLNRFFGGYSDDEFIGIDGSFWRASGLEIRRFPRRIQVQKKLTDEAGANIDRQVHAAIVTSQFGDTIAAGDNGQVYRRAQGASTWTKVYTDTGNDKILDICEYNGYIYWTTRNKLHRIAMTDTGTSVTWTTVTEDYQSLTYDSTDAHPMIQAFNTLWVGDGDQLASLDSAGTWTANALQLPFDDLIRKLTFTGTLIKAWSRKQSNFRDEGAVTFWNGVSDSYQERTPLDGMFQTATTADGGVDFFIAGHRPWLYRLDGLTAVKLKELPMLTNPSADDNSVIAVDFAPNAMTAKGGVVYFGTPTSLSIGVNWMEDGVWSWGRKDEKYPFSLNLDFPASSDKVTCVFVAEGKVNFADVDGSTEHLYVETPSAYQTTGEIETRWIDGAEAEQIKDAKKLAIAFWPLAADEKIEVYCRTNMGTTYGSAILTASYANSLDVGKAFKELLSPFTGKEFNTIQFKVKLTAGTSQATTPKLLDFILGFEDIEMN